MEKNGDIVSDHWIFCPQCFRVFRRADWHSDTVPAKLCVYPDCNWRHKSLSPYIIDYQSLRLLNPHLPQNPKRGVVYSEGTVLAIPHGMAEDKLQKLIDRLKEADEAED